MKRKPSALQAEIEAAVREQSFDGIICKLVELRHAIIVIRRVFARHAERKEKGRKHG